MNRQKLVYVDARSISESGSGLSRYAEEVVHHLAKNPSLKVVLVSNKQVKPKTDFFKTIDISVDDGIWRFVPGTLWLLLRVPYLLWKAGADVFIGANHVLPLFKPYRVKYSMVVHDLVHWLYPTTMTITNRAVSKLLFRPSIMRADLVLAISETTCSDLLSFMPSAKNKTVVCFPGVSHNYKNEFRQDKRESAAFKSFLFVGSKEPRKNLLPFLQAFHLAVRQGMVGRLHLVGGSGWDAGYGAAVDELISHPNIEVHGFIDDKGLNKLYDTVDFVVMPSIYEGLGLPILEAIGRCGVIANDIPVFRELRTYLPALEIYPFEFERANLDGMAQFIRAVKPSVLKFSHSETSLKFCWERCSQILSFTDQRSSQAARCH